MDRRITIAAVAVIIAFSAVVLLSYDREVTVDAVPGEGIERIEGAGTYEEGEEVVLTAFLERSYSFIGWYSPEGTLLGTDTVLRMSAGDVTVTARAAAMECVTVTVVCDEGIASVSGGGEFARGTDIVLTAEPADRYFFEGWFSDDGTCLGNTSVITIKAEQMTVEARSDSPLVVHMELSGDEGVKSVAGAGDYGRGQKVRISADVYPEYTFQGWYGDNGQLLYRDRTAIVNASDRGLHARTSVNPPVTLSLSGDEGILSLPEGGEFPTGHRFELDADLKTGFAFDGWFTPDGVLLSTDRTLTLELREDTELVARTVSGYSVTVLEMPGVETVGGGSFGPDESAELKVTFDHAGTFTGWYTVGGELLSTDPVYVPAREDAVVVAGTDADHFSGGERLPFDYPEWYGDDSYCYVKDLFSLKTVVCFEGKARESLSLVSGDYEVVYSNGQYGRTEVRCSERVELGDSIVQHFHWVSSGKDYDIDWSVSREKYGGLDPVMRTPFTNEMKAGFVSDSTGEITYLVQILKGHMSNMNKLQKADFLLDFVQGAVEYQSDSDYNGVVDYWKFPIETLMEHRGDCEDSSVLYASMLNALDCEVVLFELESSSNSIGHMAVGLCMGYEYGETWEYDGRQYILCETTNDTSDVGDWGWGDIYDKVNTIEV